MAAVFARTRTEFMPSFFAAPGVDTGVFSCENRVSAAVSCSYLALKRRRSSR